MKKISRRNFLKATSISAAALGLAACGGSSSSAPASKPASSAASAPEVVWPGETLDIYVPNRAGSNSDLAARILIDWLAAKYPKTKIVAINETTGDGTMAMELTRTAKPDGSVLMFTGSGSNIMYHQGKYNHSVIDPANFTVVSRAPGGNGMGSILLTQPDKPYNNLQEFVDYCKANPGKVNVATNTGNTQEIKMKLLMMKFDLDVKYVILSGGDLITALLAGNVDVGLQSDNKAAQYIAAGELKGLVNNTFEEDGRDEQWTKNIDTYYDLGLTDISFVAPMYIIGPGNMDRALAEKINEVINEVEADEECQSRWNDMNSSYVAMDLDEIQEAVVSLDNDVKKVMVDGAQAGNVG